MPSFGEIEDRQSRPVSRVSSMSGISLSELELDPNSHTATLLRHYLDSPQGDLAGQGSDRDADQVQDNGAEQAISDYAERESSQVYIVFWTAKRNKGSKSEKPRNPRWFIAWKVGPESEDSSEWSRLCVLELRKQDGAYSYFGPVLRDEKLGTKYSVCIGELHIEDRVKLEAVARATPVQGKNDQEWVKELLKVATAEGIFSLEVVHEALKYAEDGSHTLRRESRRLRYVV